ncbi:MULTISPECIES: hypothetical protein [Cupriavidus]
MTSKTPYRRGDLRRMLAVLAAIDRPHGARLVDITQATGLDKKSVTLLLAQAAEEAGVAIRRDAMRFHVADWGPVIRRTGVRLALTAQLGGTVQPPTAGAH